MIGWTAVVLVLGAAAAVAPGAQDTTMLAPPAGVITCRGTTDSLDGEQVLLFEMVEQGMDPLLGGRSLTAGYRADGTPVSLMVHGPAKAPSGTKRYEGVVVQFKTAEGFRTMAEEDTASTKISTSRAALQVSEIAQANRLADWIWAHRCKIRE